MRAIRTFAFAAAICTLAACSTSPTLSAPAAGVSRDNGGLIGTGNNTAVPSGPSFSSSGVSSAPGTVGSGNITSSSTTTTVTTCTDENGGLLGTGNNTGTGTCDNGGLMGSGN